MNRSAGSASRPRRARPRGLPFSAHVPRRSAGSGRVAARARTRCAVALTRSSTSLRSQRWRRAFPQSPTDLSRRAHTHASGQHRVNCPGSSFVRPCQNALQPKQGTVAGGTLQHTIARVNPGLPPRSPSRRRRAVRRLTHLPPAAPERVGADSIKSCRIRGSNSRSLTRAQGGGAREPARAGDGADKRRSDRFRSVGITNTATEGFDQWVRSDCDTRGAADKYGVGRNVSSRRGLLRASEQGGDFREISVAARRAIVTFLCYDSGSVSGFTSGVVASGRVGGLGTGVTHEKPGTALPPVGVAA